MARSATLSRLAPMRRGSSKAGPGQTFLCPTERCTFCSLAPNGKVANRSALRARGHSVMHVPLLRIEANPTADLGDGAYAAVAVTSANAIACDCTAPAQTVDIDVPTFAVGERTAETAREAGFMRSCRRTAMWCCLRQLLRKKSCLAVRSSILRRRSRWRSRRQA